MADREPKSSPRGRPRLWRAVLIASLVFVAILGAIAVTAMVSGERQSLEFDYEGFD